MTARGPALPALKAAAPSAADIKRLNTANQYACDGAALIHQGQPVRAIALLQRSIELNPRVAAAHHDLGVALMAAGRLEPAAEAFSRALRLDPDLASAHHNLAFILDGLGREDQALASYAAAVKLRPDLSAAQLRLGDLYLARRRNKEAETAFLAVAVATAGTVTAQIAQARALEAAGAAAEALATMRAIVETEPENAQAHAALGRLLAQGGESAEAAAHFERAASLSPDMLGAWYGVATNKKFTPADAPLLAQINAALARPNLKPSDRQALHFALGKAHDDLGRYEAAIRHVDAANKIRAANGRLNRQGLVRRIDAIIASTPPGFAEQARLGVEDETPILIVGMPRSGTTLVEQILSSHPQVAAGDELAFWGDRDSRSPAAQASAPDAEAMRRLAEDYLATLRAIGPDARRVTDKAPFNFVFLGTIHRVFPRATLVHCQRHPIDTCLSIFSTNFEMSIDFAADRSDLVFFYRQYQRLMAHWREVLPQDRLIEVNYESLVTDPEPYTRSLVAACGLEWDEACLAPQRNSRRIATASLWQARQPIYRTSVERWRRYEPWLGELRTLAPTTSSGA